MDFHDEYNLNAVRQQAAAPMQSVSNETLSSIQSDLENLKVYILQGRFKMTNDEAKVVAAVQSEVRSMISNERKFLNEIYNAVCERLDSGALNSISRVEEKVDALAQTLSEQLVDLAVGLERKLDSITDGNENLIQKGDLNTDESGVYNEKFDRIEQSIREIKESDANPVNEVRELGDCLIDTLKEENEKLSAVVAALDDKVELLSSEIAVLRAKLEESAAPVETDKASEENEAEERIMSTLESLTGKIDKLKDDDNVKVDSILAELKEFKQKLAAISSGEVSDEDISASFMSLKNELENISTIIDDEEEETAEEKNPTDDGILPSAISMVSNDLENNLKDLFELESERENGIQKAESEETEEIGEEIPEESAFAEESNEEALQEEFVDDEEAETEGETVLVSEEVRVFENDEEEPNEELQVEESENFKEVQENEEYAESEKEESAYDEGIEVAEETLQDGEIEVAEEALQDGEIEVAEEELQDGEIEAADETSQDGEIEAVEEISKEENEPVSEGIADTFKWTEENKTEENDESEPVPTAVFETDNEIIEEYDYGKSQETVIEYEDDNKEDF